MKRSEFYPLESLVVDDYRINEAAKIVVIEFQELDRLHLPHLFNFYVIKQFTFSISLFLLFLYGSSRGGLRNDEIPLEDNDEEFAIFSLGYLNEKLYSSPHHLLYEKHLPLVGHAEALCLMTWLHALRIPKLRGFTFHQRGTHLLILTCGFYTGQSFRLGLVLVD